MKVQTKRLNDTTSAWKTLEVCNNYYNTSLPTQMSYFSMQSDWTVYLCHIWQHDFMHIQIPKDSEEDKKDSTKNTYSSLVFGKILISFGRNKVEYGTYRRQYPLQLLWDV